MPLHPFWISRETLSIVLFTVVIFPGQDAFVPCHGRDACFGSRRGPFSWSVVGEMGLNG